MDIINLIKTDYTLQIVALGSAILGILSGMLGSFAVIRKESLLGDAVSHAALPGIAIAFLVTQTKNTEVLLLGALISGLIATFLILFIERYSRVKFDSSLALILSVFFGAGLVLLTYIQKLPDADQAGLDKFILGQASTLLRRDIYLMVGVGVVLIGLLLVFWKEFKISSFDPDFAESIGFSNNIITGVLFSMMVVSIIIGLQTVGVILMSAMLTAPGVAARQWTDKLSIMVILAAIFGALAGIVGTIISSVVPDLPTGPTIVIVMSIIVFISLILAPNRGLLWNYLKRKKSRKEIDENELLSNLYKLSRSHGDLEHYHSILTIKPNKLENETLLRLEKLEDKGMARRNKSEKWVITEKGVGFIEEFMNEGGEE